LKNNKLNLKIICYKENIIKWCIRYRLINLIIGLLLVLIYVGYILIILSIIGFINWNNPKYKDYILKLQKERELNKICRKQNQVEYLTNNKDKIIAGVVAYNLLKNKEKK